MIGMDVLLGGVTGLVGNVITSVMNYKTLKMKNAHEAKMVTLETEAMKQEAQMQIAVTRTEVEGAVELADSNAYMESIKVGNKAMFSDKWIDKIFSVEGKMGRFFAVPAGVTLALGFGFVDWLRGFIRPGITIYFTGLATLITFYAWDIIQKHGVDAMTADEAIGIYNQSTSIILYLTTTIVCWWFGDRSSKKFLTNLDNKGKE